LIADALQDCSRRGETVLDIFGGSGSTLIAAESCGRVARLLEYDPLYCDTTVERWQRFTGKTATLLGSDDSFEKVAEARMSQMQATAEIPPRKISAHINPRSRGRKHE
jgi:DNA modification methylase